MTPDIILYNKPSCQTKQRQQLSLWLPPPQAILRCISFSKNATLSDVDERQTTGETALLRFAHSVVPLGLYELAPVEEGELVASTKFQNNDISQSNPFKISMCGTTLISTVTQISPLRFETSVFCNFELWISLDQP